MNSERLEAIGSFNRRWITNGDVRRWRAKIDGQGTSGWIWSAPVGQQKKRRAARRWPIGSQLRVVALDAI
jgi:hypothetical protein